jgi:hypothetical protein
MQKNAMIHAYKYISRMSAYDVQDEDKDELTHSCKHRCQSTGALLVIAVVQDLTHSNAKHNHSDHGDNHTGQLSSSWNHADIQMWGHNMRVEEKQKLEGIIFMHKNKRCIVLLIGSLHDQLARQAHLHEIEHKCIKHVRTMKKTTRKLMRYRLRRRESGKNLTFRPVTGWGRIPCIPTYKFIHENKHAWLLEELNRE